MTNLTIKTRTDSYGQPAHDIVDQDGCTWRSNIGSLQVARQIRDRLQWQEDLLAAEGLTHEDVQA